MNLEALLHRGVREAAKADPRAQWWTGVVMIIRADPLTMPKLKMPMAHIMSACRVEYGGARAIRTRVPYSCVAHLFKAGDGDAIEHYAELKGEHLQFHERASKTEFFTTQEKGSLSQAALQ